jgi:PAB-dependent poly(A)-specific ribonuclease subunit 2
MTVVRFYNKTRFSGLETHIANSYTNAVLQALRFSRPVRKIAEAHTCDSCPKVDCLLCEAGFLFRMLKDAHGTNCQATNFSRAFSASAKGRTPLLRVGGELNNVHSTARTLGLMDSESGSSQAAYSSLIQTFNRFLFDQFADESSPVAPEGSNSVVVKSYAQRPRLPTPFAQLVNIECVTVTTCLSCGHKVEKPSTSRVIDLLYPRKVRATGIWHSLHISPLTRVGTQAMSNEPQPATDFASILRGSFTREQTSRTACPGCKASQHVRIRRVLDKDADLPPVLAVNAAISSSTQLQYWLDSGRGTEGRFLQPRIKLAKRGETVEVSQDMTQEGNEDEVEYELNVSLFHLFPTLAFEH